MKGLSWLILVILCASCQAWSPSLQRLQEQCGSNWTPPLENERTLQLLSPQDKILSATESESIRLRFKAVHSSRENIVVSSKGCVNLPAIQGILLGQNSLRSWALATNLTVPSIIDKSFHSYSFTESKPFQMNLVCPEGGWLANDRMDSILSFSGEYNPNLLDIHITAKNSHSQSFELIRKNPGFDLEASSASLDLSSLSAGDYQLQLRVRDLAVDWNSDVSTSVSTCPLQIIRHVPQFKQETLPKEKIKTLGAVLTPEFLDSSDRLFACKEPGLQSLDSEMSCSASNICREDASFKEQSTIKLDEKGRWTYYFFGRNKLGQKSKTSCTSVHVSDESPNLVVTWKNSTWNQSHAVEKNLPPELEALIEVGHRIVPKEDLATNLSCKVDFVFRGASVFPGDKVTCLSQTCQGKPMGSFVPCDLRLRFAISEALQTDFLRDSEVRLTVKAHDGAGHESLSSVSLWLQQSQYQTRDFKNEGPLLDSIEYPKYFWYTNDGGMLVQNNQSYTQIKYYYLSKVIDWPYTNSWKDVTKTVLPGIATMQSVAQNTLGRIYAIWPTYETDAQGKTIFRRFFMEFEKGTWREKTLNGWDPLQIKCDNLDAIDSGLLVCRSSNEYSVIDPIKSTVDKSSSPSDAKGQICDSSGPPQLKVNAKGQWYVLCEKGQAWLRNPDLTWEPLNYPTDVFLYIQSFAFDLQGRPWFFASDVKGDLYTRIFMYYHDGAWEKIQVPENLPAFPIDYSSDYKVAFDWEGSLRFANFKWSEASHLWIKIPEISEWLGSGPIRVRNVLGSNHGLWYENSRFMLYLDQKNRQIFPLKSLNWPSPDYPSQAALGPKGELCLNFRSQSSQENMRCQFAKSWSRIGRNYLNLPKDKIVLTSSTAEGKPLTVTANEGTFIWDGSGWVNSLPPPPLPFDKFRSIYFFEGRTLWLKQDNQVFRIQLGEKAWENVYTIPDSSYGITDWEEKGFRDGRGNIWIAIRGNRLVKFDGHTWTTLEFPREWRMQGIMPFEDKLLFCANITDTGSNIELQELRWLDPESHESFKINPSDFGWDSDLINKGTTLRSTFLAGHDSFLLSHSENFRLKTEIFDLKMKRQIRVDSYDRPYNLPISHFDRYDNEHFIVVYADRTMQRYGANSQLFLFNGAGERTYLFSNLDMKYIEENLDLAPAYWHSSVDREGYLWLPAGTFGTDVADELFRVDLKDWIH